MADNIVRPFGGPEPRPDDTVAFYKAWFGGTPEDWLSSLVRMKPSKGGTNARVAPWGGIVKAVEQLGLNELIWADGAEWDLYTSVGFLTEKPKRGFRGGLALVRGVNGCWLDLDVGKEKSFTSETECLDFAMSLGIRPTILVATGTGGVHAYWKTETTLTKEETRELCERWYIHARDIAAGIAIDKLVNPDRLMRLPGSIRWPKAVGEEVTLCRLLDTSGPIVRADDMIALTDATWEAHKDRIASTRRAVTTGREELDLASLGENRWDTLRLVMHIEDLFNESFDWADVLVPKGWVEMGRDNEERRIWSRPEDGTKKSATTDWCESPHTMSLFSTSPATGLLDLHEANIPLTKYRCFIQLHWHGDEAGFVAAYVKQLREEGH